jgi:galactose-1-phosphate uridylyltransferase
MKNITYEQHVKKHTNKENTYDENCPFCNGEKLQN